MDVFQLEWISDPQISPDGQKIIYVRNYNDVMTDQTYSNLWIVNFDGTDNRPLTTGNHSDFSPRWSPDGKRVLYYGIFLTTDFKYISTIDTLSQNMGFVTPRLSEPASWNRKVPFMIVHAGKDFVPHTNESLTSFVGKAIVQNVPITLMIHSDGVHGFDIYTDNESTRQIIKNTLEFWKFYLK
jgi:acylaminoacyl-peptidase